MNSTAFIEEISPYVAPHAEVMEVIVEQGFADSLRGFEDALWES